MRKLDVFLTHWYHCLSGYNVTILPHHHHRDKSVNRNRSSARATDLIFLDTYLVARACSLGGTSLGSSLGHVE
jgi:hypothetical protein